MQVNNNSASTVSFVDYNSKKDILPGSEKSDVLIKFGEWNSEVERPSTPEIKKHDKQKEFILTIYELLHPEPEQDPPSLHSLMGGKHAQWERERNKFEQQWENNYRENNPEYTKQIEEYEEKVKEENRKKWVYC